jgi:hypothetical protein
VEPGAPSARSAQRLSSFRAYAGSGQRFAVADQVPSGACLGIGASWVPSCVDAQLGGRPLRGNSDPWRAAVVVLAPRAGAFELDGSIVTQDRPGSYTQSRKTPSGQTSSALGPLRSTAVDATRPSRWSSPRTSSTVTGRLVRESTICWTHAQTACGSRPMTSRTN